MLIAQTCTSNSRSSHRTYDHVKVRDPVLGTSHQSEADRGAAPHAWPLEVPAVTGSGPVKAELGTAAAERSTHTPDNFPIGDMPCFAVRNYCFASCCDREQRQEIKFQRLDTSTNVMQRHKNRAYVGLLFSCCMGSCGRP